MKWSLWFWFMKQWVKVTLLNFYGRFTIHNTENIPLDSPVLFTPNHQNAFMDAISITCFVKPQTSFLVRADVFKAKLAAKLLHSLKMMPIYRQRDGADNLEKNEAIFDYCYQLLNADNAIILFPEGNHNNQKKLRPLKKGVSRIAFGAEVKYDYKLGVQVVPMGLNYSNYTDMGAELLINVGTPIDLRQYHETYKQNAAKGLLALKNELSARMSELIIDIQVKELYDTLEVLYPMSRQAVKAKLGLPGEYDQVTNFQADKHLIAAVEAKHAEDPTVTETLKSKVSAYAKAMKAQGFRDRLFEESHHKGLLWQLLFLVIFSPAWVYGVINNYLPFKIPEAFVQSKIKDKHFHSSIKVAFGLIMFPLFWTIQTLVVWALVPHWEWMLIYWLSLPVSARFALDYWRAFKKFRARFRYNRMRHYSDPKFVEIETLRKEILSIVDSLL